MLDQDFLGSSERLQKFFKMIPDDTLREQVQKNLEKGCGTSLEKWHIFVDTYETYLREVI